MSEKFSTFVTNAPALSLPTQATDWVAVTRAGVTYHIAGNAFAPVASTYLRVAPLTGATLTAPSGLGGYICVPAAQIAALTAVTPPAAVDGQEFFLSTTQTIVTLSVTPAAGQSVSTGSIGTLGAGGGVRFKYDLSNTTWYRII